MTITLKTIGLGVLFVAILASGVWLAKTGKPYNTLLFNIHKLISLITFVLAGILVYGLYHQAATHPILLPLIIVAGLLFLLLLVSGGLLNTEISIYNGLRVFHRIAPVMLIILMVVIFWLLLKK